MRKLLAIVLSMAMIVTFIPTGFAFAGEEDINLSDQITDQQKEGSPAEGNQEDNPGAEDQETEESDNAVYFTYTDTGVTAYMYDGKEKYTVGTTEPEINEEKELPICKGDDFYMQGTTTTITGTSRYVFEGSCSSGNIVVSAIEEEGENKESPESSQSIPTIVLAGLNLTGSDNNPAIIRAEKYDSGSTSLNLVAEKNTSNTLKAGKEQIIDKESDKPALEAATTEQGEDESKQVPCIFADGIEICGEGTLNVNGDGGTGIAAGTMNVSDSCTVNTNGDGGIGIDAETMNVSGSCTVNTNGDGGIGIDAETMNVSGSCTINTTGSGAMGIVAGSLAISENCKLNATGGNGISAGNANISGGTTTVYSASKETPALDCKESLYITGGTVFAAGNAEMTNLPKTDETITSQGYVTKKGTFKKNQYAEIITAMIHTIGAYTLQQDVNHIFFSSPKVAKNTDIYVMDILNRSDNDKHEEAMSNVSRGETIDTVVIDAGKQTETSKSEGKTTTEISNSLLETLKKETNAALKEVAEKEDIPVSEAKINEITIYAMPDNPEAFTESQVKFTAGIADIAQSAGAALEIYTSVGKMDLDTDTVGKIADSNVKTIDFNIARSDDSTATESIYEINLDLIDGEIVSPLHILGGTAELTVGAPSGLTEEDNPTGLWTEDDFAEIVFTENDFSSQKRLVSLEMKHFSTYLITSEAEADAILKASAGATPMGKLTLKAYKNGKIKAAWQNGSKGNTDSIVSYQIYRSTDKKFRKNVKKYTVKAYGSSEITSSYTGAYTITKNLKKGKRYYVKVRASIKLNGKTYKSQWTATKSIKCRKTR